jgi:alpha-beta hydrolase superfamily lysophospholipase
MWSRPWVWDPWRDLLVAAGYTCQAITLPGHEALPGEPAPAGLGQLSIQDYVAAVQKVVESSPTPPILIGHSMGGLIAQMVAAQAGVASRFKVAAVVGVNSAAPGAVFPLRPVTLPGTLRHFANPLLWRLPFRLNSWEARYLLFNAFDPVAADEMASQIVFESGRVAWQIGFGPLNLAGSNRVDKSQITAPLLLLAGEKDRIVPIGASRAVARWYGSQAVCREYPQHAHWLLGEPAFEAAVQDVLNWFETFENP